MACEPKMNRWSRLAGGGRGGGQGRGGRERESRGGEGRTLSENWLVSRSSQTQIIFQEVKESSHSSEK